MLDKLFTGKITSVSAKVKKIKNEKGEKENYPLVKFKIETDNIDYDSILDYDSTISSVLNNQPLPFTEVDFGDISMVNMCIHFYETSGDNPNEVDDATQPNASFRKVMINDFKVKNKENIPNYTFTFEIPMEISPAFLFANIKNIVAFKLTV
jgi:hypothetical protein